MYTNIIIRNLPGIEIKYKLNNKKKITNKRNENNYNYSVNSSLYICVIKEERHIFCI